jgi:hypothetical protein
MSKILDYLIASEAPPKTLDDLFDLPEVKAMNLEEELKQLMRDHLTLNSDGYLAGKVPEYRGPLDRHMVDRARRAANRRGWRVEKSRQRTQHLNNRGGLMLLDENNNVIEGVNYDLAPEQVIEKCHPACPQSQEC